MEVLEREALMWYVELLQFVCPPTGKKQRQSFNKNDLFLEPHKFAVVRSYFFCALLTWIKILKDANFTVTNMSGFPAHLIAGSITSSLSFVS